MDGNDILFIAVPTAAAGGLLLALFVILLCCKFRSKNNSSRLSSNRVSNPGCVLSQETLTITTIQDSGDTAGLRMETATTSEKEVSSEEPTGEETEIHPKQTSYLQNETSVDDEDEDDEYDPKFHDYLSMNRHSKSIRRWNTFAGVDSSPDVNTSPRLPCQSIPRLHLPDQYNNSIVKYTSISVAQCSPRAEKNMENESALNRVEHEELVSVCQKGNQAQALAGDVDQNVSFSESVPDSLDNLFKDVWWRATPSGFSEDFLRDDPNVPQRHTTEWVPGQSLFVTPLYVEMDAEVSPFPYKTPTADKRKNRRRTMPDHLGNNPRNSSVYDKASEHYTHWCLPHRGGNLYLTDEHPPSRHNPKIPCYVNFRGTLPKN